MIEPRLIRVHVRCQPAAARSERYEVRGDSEDGTVHWRETTPNVSAAAAMLRGRVEITSEGWQYLVLLAEGSHAAEAEAMFQGRERVQVFPRRGE